MERLIGLFGIVFLLGVAWLLSENRKKVRPKIILFGISLQILIALFVLKTAPGKWVFQVLNDAVGQMLNFTGQGSSFVFGKGMLDLGSFALVILPTIVFFSAFFTVLYYFGILQFIVKIFAVVLRRLLGTSGAEALSTAANVFMGQTEAPLMVKPYVEKMTRSELMCVMTGGMATVAGGVLAAYVGMGIEAGHLIAASVMNAPAAIVFAKLLVPETAVPQTADIHAVKIEITDKNPIEAASRGASEGLFLAMNVAAMLLAFVAFVGLFNAIFGIFGTSMQEVLGTLMRPVAFLMGVPWEDSAVVGTLLGEKTVINEFIAYQHLGEHLRAASLANVHQGMIGGLPFVGEFIGSGAAAISHKASVITTYALCGFANFSSIAIQLGGIGSMAPSRRGEIASLGLRAMLAGTLATFLSGTIAGILL